MATLRGRFSGLIIGISCFLCCLATPPKALAQPPKPSPTDTYWLLNRGEEVLLFDGPSDSEIICGELKKGERVRLFGLLNNYYKVKTDRGNCRGNIGYLQRSSGDLAVLKSKGTAPRPNVNQPPMPQPNQPSLIVSPASQSKTSLWEERWGVPANFYLGGKIGMGLGVTAIEDNSFVGGLEFGYVPINSAAFLLALPITYSSSAPMDIGDNIVVDVALLTVAASPQYRYIFGDSPWFASLQGDVGVTFAFGSLSESINNVSDFSLALRPALGIGKHENGSPWVYGFHVGLQVMPLGFGFVAMQTDFTAGMQYWF